MSIPQKADKWIVFALMFALGVVDLLRSTVPGGFTAIQWATIPLIAAVLFTTCYVIWCTACLLIARLLLIIPTSRNVRILANVSFLVIMLALTFAPYETTVTFQVPVKVGTQTPVPPRPGQSAGLTHDSQHAAGTWRLDVGFYHCPCGAAA
jgi:hypothetical protein